MKTYRMYAEMIKKYEGGEIIWEEQDFIENEEKDEKCIDFDEIMHKMDYFNIKITKRRYLYEEVCSNSTKT